MTEKQQHALLLQVARALYGPSWQTPLAEALDANLRTVQRWATGQRLPSADTWGRLAYLVRKHRHDLDAILGRVARAERLLRDAELVRTGNPDAEAR